ncbi:MAG: T9SS type A sorting domain-containing protein [Bacteroidota bacterium]|nr:T9SS type A sorting domain-containing protein [Bacteroidota bacterium]
MKKIIYSLIFLCFSIYGFSQACLPDSSYRDSTAGVYPKPITDANPKGGINKKACINHPYEFVFTVVIPDSILLPLLPTPIPLSFAKIDTVGAIKNLPEGIMYSCNPPDCVYPKNTIGCVILHGTPTANNTPGDFKPIIKLTIGTPFGNFEIEYPGPQFPGEYILTLLDESCQTGTKDLIISNDFWYPNPTQGHLKSKLEGAEKVMLYNSHGKMLHKVGEKSINQLNLRPFLSEGIYFICWIQGGTHYQQKIQLVD